jgi:hypothetical protein
MDLVNLTSYCLLAGDDAAAAEAAREAVTLVAELDDPQTGADFTGGLALLAARAGAWDMAVKRAGHTDQFYLSTQQTMEVVQQRVWDALMALFNAAEATGALTAQTRTPLMEQGAALSLQEALRLPMAL